MPMQVKRGGIRNPGLGGGEWLALCLAALPWERASTL